MKPRLAVASNRCLYCGRRCGAILRVCPVCLPLPAADPLDPSYWTLDATLLERAKEAAAA